MLQVEVPPLTEEEEEEEDGEMETQACGNQADAEDTMFDVELVCS